MSSCCYVLQGPDFAGTSAWFLILSIVFIGSLLRNFQFFFSWFPPTHKLQRNVWAIVFSTVPCRAGSVGFVSISVCKQELFYCVSIYRQQTRNYYLSPCSDMCALWGLSLLCPKVLIWLLSFLVFQNIVQFCVVLCLKGPWIQNTTLFSLKKLVFGNSLSYIAATKDVI